MIEVPKIVYWAGLGNLQRVREAYAENPDANLADAQGYSALHAAAENGYLDVLEFLLDHGADPGATAITGQTPLELAKSAGHAEVVRTLQARSNQD